MGCRTGRTVVAAPLEQQICVDTIFECELGHRDPRLAREGGELAFEVDRVVRAPLAGYPGLATLDNLSSGRKTVLGGWTDVRS